MCGGLDAFGHDAQVQLLRQGDDGGHDGRILVVVLQLVHEAAVDLQLGGRQALQVQQARIAGAEVVDGNGHAQAGQALEHRQAGLGVTHGRRFGHFQRQAGRRHVVPGERAAHRLDQAGMRELQRRDVHGDSPVALARVDPFAHLAAGFVDDPVADRQDQAGLFRRGNEQVRADQAARGVVPAQQRLGADDRAGRRFIFGLVVQHELAALLRQPQVVQQLDLFVRVGVHRRLEEAVAGAAQALGVIHGGVGVGQQRVGVLAVVGIDGDAHAGCHQHFVAVDRHGPRDGVDQAVGHAGGVGRFAHFAQDDEFVAAQSRNGVLGAQSLADALRQVDEQRVAGMVAVGVVDRLETVQVEEQHREIALAPAGAFDGLLHAVFEQNAVGQLGERVVQGQLHQFFVGFGQRRRQGRGASFQPVVQHRHDQRDAQHAQGHGGDGDGQPASRQAAIGGQADAVVRKARGLHAGVVHADDGQPHRHRRQRP